MHYINSLEKLDTRIAINNVNLCKFDVGYSHMLHTRGNLQNVIELTKKLNIKTRNSISKLGEKLFTFTHHQISDLQKLTIYY